MDNKIKAVCALIIGEFGDVLSVTRKTNYQDWGLPGGKLDSGETYLQALVRETLEETGLTIEPVNLSYFEVIDGEYLVRTYLCKVLDVKRVITSEHETGLVEFRKPIELLKGSFKEYNLECFLFFKLALDFESLKDLFRSISNDFCISSEIQLRLLKDSLIYHTPIDKELSVTTTELIDTAYVAPFLKYYNFLMCCNFISDIEITLNWNSGIVVCASETKVLTLTFYHSECEFKVRHNFQKFNFIKGSLKTSGNYNKVEEQFNCILNMLRDDNG